MRGFSSVARFLGLLASLADLGTPLRKSWVRPYWPAHIDQVHIKNSGAPMLTEPTQPDISVLCGHVWQASVCPLARYKVSFGLSLIIFHRVEHEYLSYYREPSRILHRQLLSTFAASRPWVTPRPTKKQNKKKQQHIIHHHDSHDSWRLASSVK